MSAEAEVYKRALRAEKAWGLEHTSTLSTVNNLGIPYKDRGRIVEAEEIYTGIARIREGVGTRAHVDAVHGQQPRPRHTKQDKIAEAEEMYMRALRGYEKGEARDYPSTQMIARNLHSL